MNSRTGAARCCSRDLGSETVSPGPPAAASPDDPAGAPENFPTDHLVGRRWGVTGACVKAGFGILCFKLPVTDEAQSVVVMDTDRGLSKGSS